MLLRPPLWMRGGTSCFRLENSKWCAGMADGLSNREIANEMHLSENTVKNYVYRIFNKLGVSNRVEVVMYAASQRSNPTPRRPTPVLQLPFSAMASAGTD